MSQVPNHKAYHRHIDKGFAGLRQVLIILREAALTVQPSESALYHPPTRQGYKPSLAFRLLHYLQLPAQPTKHPLDQLSSVATVCPYQLQPTKTPPMCITGFL